MELTLVSIHAMLAAFTNTPELELSEPEAKLILSATEKVGRHYVSGAVPQKAADWMALITALGSVYGPRVFTMNIRKQREASNAAKDVTPKPAGMNGASRPANPPPRPPAPGSATERASIDILNAMHNQ